MMHHPYKSSICTLYKSKICKGDASGRSPDRSGLRPDALQKFAKQRVTILVSVKKDKPRDIITQTYDWYIQGLRFVSRCYTYKAYTMFKII